MPVSAGMLAAQRRYMQQQQLRAQMMQRSRGGQAGGRGVQVGAVGQGRAAMQQQRAQQGEQKAVQAQKNARWEQVKAMSKANPKGGGGGDDGGFGGFLGGILSNPIVSNIVKPLSILSIPKNLVQTGVLELEELLLNESDKTPHWMRFMTAKPEQLNWFTPPDEVRAGRSNLDLILGREGEYKGEQKRPLGFGSMIQDIPDAHIGPVNVGRVADVALGIAGDVGLDPLTYASAGMNKVPGAVGRVQLAAEASKLGLGDDVIKAAGRYGARGVRDLGDQAAIDALELVKPGVRFGGVGGREGLRIPGTGKIGEGVDLALQKVRAPFTDTALGKVARRLGSARSPATRAAVESLVSGAETMDPSAAGNLIAKVWTEQAKERAFTGALENTGRDIAKHGKDDAAITYALEAGDRSNPVAKVWGDLNDQILERQRAADVSVGELADDTLNWVPHIPTKQLDEAWKHPTSGGFGAGSIGPESQQFSRVIKPGGKYTILGKVYEPIKATIQEGNEWGLRNVGFKLYEDSPAKLSAYAIEQAAGATGRVAGLRSLFESGSKKLFSTTDRAVTEVDKKATRAASKAAGGDLADLVQQVVADRVRSGQTGKTVDDLTAALTQLDQGAVAAPVGAAVSPNGAGPLDDLAAQIPSAGPGVPEMPVGAATPETALAPEVAEGAVGAPQRLEQQLAGVQPPQAAPAAMGAQPGLDDVASARTTLSQHRAVAEMSDLMAEAAQGISEHELEQQIARMPEHAQVLMQVTLKTDASPKAMGKLLNDIRVGRLDDQVVMQAKEGYELLRTDRLMGADTIIDSEMKRVMDESDLAMRNFMDVMNKDKGLFGKVVDEYTKFFKAWATATPGFHVRNGMSATFMNMTEGVSFKEMLDGNLIWKTWRRYGGGSELARRASRQLAPDVEWTKYLPERLQAAGQPVVDAVYASGAGGRYGAAELGQQAFGEAAQEGNRLGRALTKTYENRLTEASHNVGEHIEGRVRAGLALHALGPDGSGSWTEAVQRIKRVHFDYSDVNELDRSLRRIIPFWTFMSRNLPLQVQQMWTAPRLYSNYQSVMNNLDQDPSGNLLMPNWLQRSGARFITPGGLALAPDIGATQVEAGLGQIADPQSLLSNLNPLYKAPLQLATGQNFYYGNQYKKNDYQQPGWETSIPSQLLALIGVGKHTRTGGVVQEQKILDALKDLNPLSGQVNRLASTTADREDKGLASQLGYIGIPVRQVDQAKERKKQMNERRFAGYDEQDLRDALARFGGAA